MQQQCPRCKNFLNSRNAYDLHLLSIEGCYTSNTSIVEKITERINTLRGQVHYLLCIQPGTRGDDTILEGWHKVYFQHTHYYEPATQGFHERKDIPISQLHMKVKGGSLSRLRRFVQMEDRELYHDEEGRPIMEHDCILPSGQVQLRRQIEAQLSRALWAGMLDGDRAII